MGLQLGVASEVRCPELKALGELLDRSRFHAESIASLLQYMVLQLLDLMQQLERSIIQIVILQTKLTLLLSLLVHVPFKRLWRGYMRPGVLRRRTARVPRERTSVALATQSGLARHVSSLAGGHRIGCRQLVQRCEARLWRRCWQLLGHLLALELILPQL